MSYQLWTSPPTGYRRKGTRFEEIKSIFIDHVVAENISEPLVSCQLESNAIDAKAELRKRDFDIAGVISGNKNDVIGYLIADELKEGLVSQYYHKLETTLIISDSTPLVSLFSILKDNDFIFVLSGQSISGMITRADINKPVMRIYLFGMISLLEMHLNFWINKSFPNESWKDKINAKRLEEINNLYEERKQIKQDLTLLDCMQFCDKRDLLKKDIDFLKKFNFNKKLWHKFLRTSEKIRNSLAHSQNSIFNIDDLVNIADTIKLIDIFLLHSDEEVEELASI